MGGQVVRLMRGELSRATVYGSDPVAVARKFESEGAALIHVVDLDGAVAGAPRNLDAIRAIRSAVGCAIDLGGGIRTIEAVRDAFAAGVDRVSIGSAAILSPDMLRAACAEFPGRIFGSLDGRGGRMAIRGWVETSELTIEDAADRFRDAGVAAIAVTDIARDGAESGVDTVRMAEIAARARIPLIASGGVSSLADIKKLVRHFGDGVAGVIVGRALYEGRFSLAEALASVV